MPQGTNRPPIRETDRIAALERRLAEAERTIANLLRPKPRTHWSQVRLAQTIEEEGYSGTGYRHPIVFVDAVWDTAGSDVELTAKSAAPQAHALTLEATTLEIGAYVFVEQNEKGYWMVVDADHGLSLGETQSGGIGDGSSGMVTAKILNADGSFSTAMEEDGVTPIEEEVYSPFGAVAGTTKIAYGRDRRSGRFFAIAQRCPT